MINLLLENDTDILTAENHFWQFSNVFYAQAQVKQELLHLQNSYCFNVNRILFALWFSEWKKRPLVKQEINGVLTHSQQLESWISQIRGVRNALIKPYSETLTGIRKQLLDCELSLEKEQQKQMIFGLYESMEQALRQKQGVFQIKNVALINLQAMHASPEFEDGTNVPEVFTHLIKLWCLNISGNSELLK